IEFWRSLYAPDCDIKLTPLVLTATQVEAFQLPRIPIKESDVRKDNFERRHGTGATELDALEALYPGELEQIVRDAVAPYQDATLQDRLREAEHQADETIADQWDTITAPAREQLDAIEAEVVAITAKYADQLRQELAPMKEKLDALQREVRASA